MHVLMIVAMMLLAAVMVTFEGGVASPSQERSEAVAGVATYQFEAFASAAWFAARAGATGSIDRSAMQLPAGFMDGNRLQARAEGGFLYVWDPSWAATQLDRAQLDRVFPEADASVDVGFSDASTIYFRDSETASKPGWLPNSIVIVRLRI